MKYYTLPADKGMLEGRLLWHLYKGYNYGRKCLCYTYGKYLFIKCIGLDTYHKL